ncbi:hypothetical protein QP551_06505 [Slackia exigua]|uniref:hypothetical protein n=1 Tax=Slackia exigua TaxID=84109 RepID=UPI00254F0F2C|nr:hypothetical protein [Slackia exigua]MDK7724344.1 hypothetical protein [Slackia exigua]MDK7725672.1 hypothetical protein [Slackia exigua]
MATDFERLARANEQIAQERAQQDNGFSRPAENDEAVLSRQRKQQAQAASSPEEKKRALSRLITRQPLNRELMMRILSFCSEERTIADIDEFVAQFPEADRATENPAYMTKSLAREGGLSVVEHAADGRVVAPEEKDGLTEDEVDDLVASVGYLVTDTGRAVAAEHSPAARLADLMGARPDRAETFEELLRFVKEEPRSYDDIKSLLAGRPVLETVINGRTEAVQPSVFVDKLERAGVLAWDKGWKLTEEGRSYLSDL